MPSMSVSLRNVPGTEAAMGWADGHTLVIDRALGKAGGMGLGFNGGQMIALAIGGCFCNDLRYMAEAMAMTLGDVSVDVSIELEGQPMRVTSATMRVHVTSTDAQADIAELLRRTEDYTVVGNSVRSGFPLTITSD